MLKTLALVLPVMIPSWQFFKTIAPSPRVQWRLLDQNRPISDSWHEFHPRPQKLSIIQMLGQLFWNPVWNDNLFVVSCCERISEEPTQHSITQIRLRILDEIEKIHGHDAKGQMEFRIILKHRQAGRIVQDLIYRSPHFPLQTAHNELASKTSTKAP